MCVERDQRIAELTRQKYTADRIAAIERITPRSVHAARRRLGIAQPPAKPFTNAEYTRAEELLDDGASYRDVAATLGRDPKTIAYHFPGRGWSHEQSNEAKAMILKLASL